MTNIADSAFLDCEDLLASLADAVYAIDVRGCFTYLNPAASVLFGRSPAELLGSHFSKVVDPDSLETATEHFRRGLEDPDQHPYFETRIRRPDGEIRELEVHSGSVYCDDRVIGRQGVCRDITELRRLQSELVEKTSRLALLEDQHRTAVDLYRRLKLMITEITSHPQQVDRDLDKVDDMIYRDVARTAGLDEQDLPIIRMLADGYSNHDIAEEIHLSIHTVKDRVSRIITKLGARSRAGVATRAYEAGILPTVSPRSGRAEPGIC